MFIIGVKIQNKYASIELVSITANRLHKLLLGGVKMLVRDVIAGIESKELSVKQLSEQYNVSDRTVQNKIKSLGFKWHPSKAVYEYIEQDGKQDEILASSFDSLFNSTNKSKNANTRTNKSRSERTSKNTSISRSESEIASTSESIDESLEIASDIENDIIDILLSGKNINSKRTYRGFYFDADVLEIVDRASNKSELINQALRKVFKDKGLL